MKFKFAMLILAILTGNVYAEECLPAGSGGCTGDIVQVNSSLNVRFGSVNYVGYLQFWNKTSCTLKPFKYQIEYDGTVLDNEGRSVPGKVTEKYESPALSSHGWTTASDHRDERINIYGGAKNPRVVVLSPLECKAE